MDFDYDVVIVGGAFLGAATALPRRRLATGHFARNNSGWRELYDGFVPDFRVTKLLRKGLFRWWRAELTSLRLMFVSPVAESLKEPSAASTVAA
jgi:hypothetical protein